MIVIGKPEIKVKSGKARLCASVSIPELAYQRWVTRIGSMERYSGYEKMYQYQAGKKELWYETDEESARGFCAERNDAFVLAVLYFAMVAGEDIKSIGPLSEEFCHSVNTSLIPIYCNESSGYKPIRVIAETTSEMLESQGENGTGISCGVDSLDTVFRYLDENVEPSHRLTCLCLFNSGAFHNMPEMKKCISGQMTVKEWDKEAFRQFRLACVQGNKVADELGLKFVSVDSNISSLYQGVFLQSHAYRNCSNILALSKMFGRYYYASAGDPGKPWFGLENAASDNVWLFSTETVRFYLGSQARTRIEKLNYISNYPLARKYLHVCCEKTYNCGKCGKCFPTVLILDIIGKLDDFASSFEDLDYYRKKGWKKYVWILDKRHDDQFAMDMYAYMKKNNIHASAMAWIYHFTLPVRRLVRKVIKR